MAASQTSAPVSSPTSVPASASASNTARQTTSRKGLRLPGIFRRGSRTRTSRARSIPSRSRFWARAGRVVIALLALALLVLPVLLIAHPISYVPLIAAVLLVITSAVYLQVARRAASVSVAEMQTSLERGEKASLTVALSNTSLLPLPRIDLEFFVTDLFGNYDEITKLTCAMSPREVGTLDFDVRFAHLGSYEAGIDHVVIHDLLGLFSSRLSDTARRTVVVRPRKVDMDSVRAMQVVLDESKSMLRPVASDDMDYANVREYRYGDPLKTIHWNLTARNPSGTMYARLYEAYVNPSLVIVMDAYSPPLDSEELMSLFDGMVESSVALASEAREAGIDAELRYLDTSHIPTSLRLATASDADSLVAAMLRITPEGEAGAYAASTEEMLRSAGLASHGFGNVALVTSRVDASLLTALTEIRMRRRNVMVFVCVPRTLTGKKRESFLAPLHRLGATGITYYAVESTEIETKVEGL